MLSAETLKGIHRESVAYPQTHPERLATIGRIFGMTPTPVDACRVLEIGCAEGGNLLPMAAGLPGSQFVGIDIAPTRIERARTEAAGAGLKNVELYATGIENLDGTFGSFDYIIAHGVYSWVPAPVREALLEFCRRSLSEQGIALLSYNTKPGSQARENVREMLKYRFATAGKQATDEVAAARAFLGTLAKAFETRTDAWGAQMRQELAEIAAAADSYLAEEYLAESAESFWFHEVASALGEHRMQYLGEVELPLMSMNDLAAEAKAAVRQVATDVLTAEQYMDFARGRAFRQTLFCREEVALERSVSPARMEGLWVASSAKAKGEIDESMIRSRQRIIFEGADGFSFGADEPFVKAAFAELEAAWPGAIGYGELCERAAKRSGERLENELRQVFAQHLFSCCAASRTMELRSQADLFTSDVNERPMATGLARWQATQGGLVTNLRHENVRLGEAERALLAALDGSLTVEALKAKFVGAGATLERLASAAVLLR